MAAPPVEAPCGRATGRRRRARWRSWLACASEAYSAAAGSFWPTPPTAATLRFRLFELCCYLTLRCCVLCWLLAPLAALLWPCPCCTPEICFALHNCIPICYRLPFRVEHALQACFARDSCSLPAFVAVVSFRLRPVTLVSSSQACVPVGGVLPYKSARCGHAAGRLPRCIPSPQLASVTVWERCRREGHLSCPCVTMSCC